jgi:hypothetical protein
LAADITLYNMFLTEAIFELLAERGILTGEEVRAHVEKLRNDMPKQSRWRQQKRLKMFLHVRSYWARPSAVTG